MGRRERVIAKTNPIKPGEVFGRLTVVYLDKDKKAYFCRCACGGETYARSYALRSGKHQSCSCGYSSPRPGRRQPDNRGPKRELYRKYKKQAAIRGYLFDLSFDFFCQQVGKNCYYCGTLPSTERTVYKRKSGDRKIMYNGIDRVDNSKGYLENNCVPCCKICNTSKSVMGLEEWKNWVRRVAKNLDLLGD